MHSFKTTDADLEFILRARNSVFLLSMGAEQSSSETDSEFSESGTSGVVHACKDDEPEESGDEAEPPEEKVAHTGNEK